MRFRSAIAVTAAAALTCLAAGCQPDGKPTLESVDAGPTQSLNTASVRSTGVAPETPTASSSVGGTATSTFPTSSPGSSTVDDDLSAQERADRAAVEAQWIKSWDVYRTLARVPEDQRMAEAESVAVDPALSLMLKDAKDLNDKGWDTYGTLGHRISWLKPIEGADEALISDCQDGSQAGSLEIATGIKKTVGVAGASFQGTMRRGTDGVWRLVQSFYLKDEQC